MLYNVEHNTCTQQAAGLAAGDCAGAQHKLAGVRNAWLICAHSRWNDGIALAITQPKNICAQKSIAVAVQCGFRGT